MASPATLVVLSSARRLEYLTGLTVIPVFFANVLETKLADAPVSNKMLALVAAVYQQTSYVCASSSEHKDFLLLQHKR
jgi:hypothetical protein